MALLEQRDVGQRAPHGAAVTIEVDDQLGERRAAAGEPEPGHHAFPAPQLLGDVPADLVRREDRPDRRAALAALVRLQTSGLDDRAAPPALRMAIHPLDAPVVAVQIA